ADARLKRLKRNFSMRPIGSEKGGERERSSLFSHPRSTESPRNYHKLSTGLVRDYDLIAFEDLKIRNMVRNHVLAKSIADAGWGQLRRFTEYKAIRVGKLVVSVRPAYSTQACCPCGALNQAPPSFRSYACRDCNGMLDRDILNLADAEPEPCDLIRPDPSAVVDDDVRLLQPLGEELQSLGVVIEQDLMGLRVTLSRSPHLRPQCVEALPESL